MKRLLLSLLFLQLSLFTACNSTKTQISNEAHQEASIKKFPTPSRRPTDSVVCQNCRATFKLAHAIQKQNGNKSYIECPICHHDYLKKAK